MYKKVVSGFFDLIEFQVYDLSDCIDWILSFPYFKNYRIGYILLMVVRS